MLHTGAVPDVDDEVGPEELRRWAGEAAAGVERYRSLRRRYLAADGQGRRQLMREQGLSGLGELDELARVARHNLEQYRTAVTARERA